MRNTLNMKQKTSQILILASLLACTSTVVFGQQAAKFDEETYDQLLQLLNDQASSMVNVVRDSFEAGETESRATTQVRKNEGNLPILSLNHILTHSRSIDAKALIPGIARIVTTIEKDSVTDADIKRFIESYEDKDPLRVETDIDNKGGSFSKMIVEAIDYDDEELHYVTEPFEATITTSQNDGLIGTVSMPSLTATDAEQLKMAIINTDINWTNKDPGSLLSTGSFSMTADKVSATTPDQGTVFFANDVSMSSTSDLDSANPSLKTSFNVPKLQTPYPINSIQQDINLSGFDVESIRQNPIFAGDREKVLAALAESPEQFLIDFFLKAGLNISQSLSFTNDGGAGLADFSITFNGDGSDSGYENIVTIGDFLAAMTININIDADSPAIMQTPLRDLVLQPQVAKYLVTDGNKFRSKIKLENSKMQINGEESAIESVLGFFVHFPVTFLPQQ